MAQRNYSVASGSITHQKGAVLIFLAFVLGLGAAAYMLKSVNAANLRAAQDEKTYRALGVAKQALIAWAVSHPNVPGMMPYPDRNVDGNYDGTSDCYASNVNFNSYFVLGQLPLFKIDPNCTNQKITASSGLADDFRDGTGERLWYEASRNLLHDYYKPDPAHPDGTAPVINSNIIQTPLYPWLEVRDRNGNILSNRVAAVIIAPEAPVGSQNRSSGIANASQYLDKIVMADGTIYSNYGYPDPPAKPVQTFIIGEDIRLVARGDPAYKNQAIEPYYFNDKLVYITIDELMTVLEKRAGQEASARLSSYYSASSTIPTNRFYPYAATIGDTNNACADNTLHGFFPIEPTAAICISNQDCRLNFPITHVKFTLAAANYYGSETGSCDRSTNTCACTGAGTCARLSSPSSIFSCTVDGHCTSSGTNAGGSFTFTYTPKVPDVTVRDSACSGGNGNVICTGAGSFSSVYSSCLHPKPGLATLPQWFTDNDWQKLMYYQLSDDCHYATPGCVIGRLTIGTKTNQHALVISAGQKLGTQSRPSSLVMDYLDGVENTNGDDMFDAVGSRKSNIYNDQIFIVAP
jgi:hypothetical protein